MPINIEMFDHINDDPEKLFALYDTVYGSSASIRKRWHWEFIEHPKSNRFRFFVAENEKGELAGMTIRMPLDVQVGGDVFPAFFATNSMVSPAFRGQNLICRLYAVAAEDGLLHLSKGTTPPMLRQLRKFGYHAIEPNNFQTCLLSPLQWAIGRVTGKIVTAKGTNKTTFKSFSDYTRIEQFNADFEEVVPSASAVVAKKTDELNWRYIYPPHRQYHCYARHRNGRIVSWCVIRCDGLSAMLADIRWHSGAGDEPMRTIRFAKSLARNLGAVKLTCWTPNARLRRALANKLFLQRKESPGFNYFSHDKSWQDLCWQEAHFVHGDGDAEYI